MVLDGEPQILRSRFSYGPLDMLSLTGEMVRTLSSFFASSVSTDIEQLQCMYGCSEVQTNHSFGFLKLCIQTFELISKKIMKKYSVDSCTVQNRLKLRYLSDSAYLEELADCNR